MEQGSARRMAFGDDGSAAADVAWLWVAEHPWPGWRIDVLTGADPPYPPEAWGLEAALAPWEPPWGRRTLEPLGATIGHERAATDPRLLLDAQTDADLIVVGHSGRGAVRAQWAGSTTEWLLHHPPAPLAIVRSAATVREVTCCFDGSVHARRALEAFAALPLAAGAHADVVVVDDGRIDAPTAAETAERVLAEGGIDVTVECRVGNPTGVVLAHLERRRPQLVVLGTRGLTGWSRLRLGSTAGAVAHTAACTTLLACRD